MMNSVFLLFVLLGFCEYSSGQRFRSNSGQPYFRGYGEVTGCLAPGNRTVTFGSRFVKVKSLAGPNGISVPGKYNCECRHGGSTYCRAFDIPCADASGNFFDLGEKFKTNVFGGIWTCVCRRGMGRYDSCVQDAVAAVGCTDYESGTRVQVGARYKLQSGGRLFQCTCGINGRYDPGSCSRYTSPTRATVVATCTDYLSRAAVQVGENYVVRSRSGHLYQCDCGSDGMHKPGTCAGYTSTAASRPTQNSNQCSGSCDANAACTYRGRGRYECVCRTGYQQAGRRPHRCSDIDECSQYRFYSGRSRCGENAVCVNTPGSYTCECDEGFTGDGNTCSLMDHCTENLDRCDINARCISSATSFQCICNDGYEGDGEDCTEIDVCAAQTDCDVNAECRATQQSYICLCQDGYTGDGRTCRKMCWDEIANQFVARGSIFLRLSPTSGQQEGCTCGVGGVSVPGSCVGPDTTTQESTTTSTTTTTAATTTATSGGTCRKRGGGVIKVNESYERRIGGRNYICTCYDRRGRAITRCRGAASKK